MPADKHVQSGDFVFIRPAHVMTHDNSHAVLSKFRSLGLSRVADPRQMVFALDHNVQVGTRRIRAMDAGLWGQPQTHASAEDVARVVV
jgi:homoaconitase/3-isopropylmalate dehydratase large subunit